MTMTEIGNKEIYIATRRTRFGKMTLSNMYRACFSFAGGVIPKVKFL